MQRRAALQCAAIAALFLNDYSWGQAVTYWPNGDVTLNLDYMSIAAADALQSALKVAQIHFKSGQKFPAVKREAWTPRVDQFIAALDSAARMGITSGVTMGVEKKL